MPFKCHLEFFLSRALASILFSGAKSFRQLMMNMCVNLFLNLDQWFSKCHLNYLLSTGLDDILFGRAELIRHIWYYGEHFCEIILKLNQWFRRSRLNISYLAL